MDLGLAGKTALVTGGSAGIGRQIAICLAQEGVDVAICARNPHRLAAALELIRASGTRVHGIAADLYDPAAPQRVVDEAAEFLGSLHILVNNVSGDSGLPKPFDEMSDALMTERISGKAFTAVRCSKAAVPHMRRVKWGRIVFIGGSSSHSVARPAAATGTYVVQGLGNAVISNFSKNLSLEVAGENIAVNVVHPHTTRTDRFESRVAQLMAEHKIDRAAAEQMLCAPLPMRRPVEPIEVAELVLFLASERARSITGQAIGVDGGACAHIPY